MQYTEEMQKYAEYLTEAELSEKTKEIYLKEAARLKEFLDGRELTKKNLIAYKEHLGTFHYAAATWNLHIVAANRYLAYAGHPECRLKTNRIQGRQSLGNVLTVEEYKSLLDYAQKTGRKKYHAIMRTLAMTGIRIGELKYFTVEALEKQVIQVTGKRKTREICLPDTLVRELKSYCGEARMESGIIFTGRGGRPIDRTSVYKMLIRMADMTGIAKEKVHPHNFRHLFAQTYMKNYANLFELADILGHSSLETTRIYARSSVSEKLRRMDQMGL